LLSSKKSEEGAFLSSMSAFFEVEQTPKKLAPSE
jgi:hypothetical protein